MFKRKNHYIKFHMSGKCIKVKYNCPQAVERYVKKMLQMGFSGVHRKGDLIINLPNVTHIEFK